MVLGYNYSKQKRWWRQTNAPHPPAILMATVVRRSNTDGITWCGMSTATLEATGHRHQATTPLVSPQRLLGKHAYKQQSTHTPAKLAILMAMAMRRYITACIARWMRSRASLEATGGPHWVSIMPNNIVWTWLRLFFNVFIVKTVGKGHRLTLRTLFFIEVWHIKQKRRA